MRIYRSMLVVLVAVGSACDAGQDPTGVASPLQVERSASMAAAGGSATGSGHYTSGGEIRTFAFSAVQRANGSAVGEFEIVIHAADAYVHVGVTCMSVRNDTAWVAGIIERTNHPVIREGTVSYFWATDGGEGPDAVDKVSTARINDRVGEDLRFCSLMPDEAFSRLPGNVVEHGNVQIRGD